MLGITKKNQTTAAEDPRPTSPALDVFENDGEFLLVADLPGVAQGGAEVTLDRDRLVLQASGVRKFRRELVVPPSVDGEHVSATMKAGVLTVHLPKRAPYQPRQIQVQSS
ncbi:MAG TPA: Hsp20/alpha crystallin family protein [Polyangiaceae bacterium]|nr:Hsp20/alpha crystallin family protein [Polyangiaceae bacterium]